MVVPVSRVPHRYLLKQESQQKEQHLLARKTIEEVRKVQLNRYGSSAKNNGNINNRDIKAHAALSPEAHALLETASKKLDLSARRYFKTIKVAFAGAYVNQKQVVSPTDWLTLTV